MVNSLFSCGLFICVVALFFQDAHCQTDPDTIVVEINQTVSATRRFLLIRCEPGMIPIRCRCASDECAGVVVLISGVCLVWATADQAARQDKLKGELHCIKANPVLRVFPQQGVWNAQRNPVKCPSGQKMIACNFIDGNSQKVDGHGEGTIDVSDDSCVPRYITECIDDTKCRLFPLCTRRPKLGIVFALDTSESMVLKANLEAQMTFVEHILDYLTNQRWFRSLDLEVFAFGFDVKASRGAADEYNSYFQAFINRDDLRNDPDKWITNFKTTHVGKDRTGQTNIGQLLDDVAGVQFNSITPDQKVLIILSDFINTETDPDVKTKADNLESLGYKILPVALDVPYVDSDVADTLEAVSGLSWDLATGLPNNNQTEELLVKFLATPTTR